MNRQIALTIKSKLSVKSFTLDTLIVKTKELFDEQGVPGFVALLLSLLDQHACSEWEELLSDAMKTITKTDKRRKNYCCSEPYFVSHDKVAKTIISSIGRLRFDWTRLYCQNCGKTFIPLRQFLGLKAHQKKSNELEQIVTELVSEQSYRRSVSHLKTIGNIKVTRNTLHRWIMDSDCDQIDPSNKPSDILIADGTCYKKRPPKSAPDKNRGEVRLALGVTKNGKVIPYGAWTKESWNNIGKKIKKANHSNKKLKFKPVANILVSDGEEKLIEGMSKVTAQVQRCQWHLVHDLPASLRYQDGAPLDETRKVQKELAAMISIAIPEKDFKAVTMEDKLELSKEIWNAEKSLDKLMDSFRSKGYNKAANYIYNSKKYLFNYLRLWMKTGIISPKASSMIERMMREIGRRIKKIGHGWSPEGAAKMARIIIKRITSADEWNEYWKKKLRLDNSVEFKFLGAKFV